MNKFRINSILIATLFAICNWNYVSYSQNQFIDDFNGNTLHPNWTIVNPNPPSLISLTGNGELEITASAANGGSDYWLSINFNAPRILTPVTGDWDLTVKMSYGPSADFEGAGILILPDTSPNGTNGTRIFERFYNTSVGQQINICGKFHSYSDNVVYVKIEKVDSKIIGAFSSDNINWSSKDTLEIGSAINYVGLHTIRKAYTGNMDEASAYFDYFHLTDSGLAIGDITQIPELILHPNPANDFTTITNIPSNSKIKVMDITGKTVYTQSIMDAQATINTMELKNGIYIVQIENNVGKINKKLIINR